MNWCCSVFKQNYGDITKRGIGIVAFSRFDGRIGFKVKFVAVDKERQQELNTPMRVSLETTMGILRCPWCGVQLDQWYKEMPVAEHPSTGRADESG